MTNRKQLVIWIVLTIVVGLGVLICAVVLPVAIQAARESTRRDRAVKNLKEIKAALEDRQKRVANSAASTTDAEPTKLPFDTYSGYFVSNKFEPDAAESFVVIGDQEQFDSVFGVAMVMGDKSHRLPEDAFLSNVVLAAIKRGDAVWEFKVEGITADDGVVQLRYAATSTKSDTATFASPLVVSIPKGEHKAVEFVENGKPAKKVEIGTR
jgi:hypothetical protein